MTITWEDELLHLREQVLSLLERVAERPPQTERPVDWAALDYSDAAEQWSVLIDWMDWLRDRYQLHERIPSCWYALGALIEELSALRTAWVGAHQDPQAELDAPAAWHELLDKTLQRTREWDLSGCSDGLHRLQQPLDDDTDHTHREQTIHADLDRREGEWQRMTTAVRRQEALEDHLDEDQPETRAVLCVEEAAELLGVSRWLLLQEIKRGHIPHKPIGRRLLFSRQRLLAWMSSDDH